MARRRCSGAQLVLRLPLNAASAKPLLPAPARLPPPSPPPPPPLSRRSLKGRINALRGARAALELYPMTAPGEEFDLAPFWRTVSFGGESERGSRLLCLELARGGSALLQARRAPAHNPPPSSQHHPPPRCCWSCAAAARRARSWRRGSSCTAYRRVQRSWLCLSPLLAELREGWSLRGLNPPRLPNHPPHTHTRPGRAWSALCGARRTSGARPPPSPGPWAAA